MQIRIDDCYEDSYSSSIAATHSHCEPLFNIAKQHSALRLGNSPAISLGEL